MTSSPPDADDGAATVLVIALILLLGCVLALLTGLARTSSARGRAQTAADLSALAGAQAVLDAQRGAPLRDACAVADAVARRNAASLQTCEKADGIVAVRVAVPTPFGPALGDARAGP